MQCCRFWRICARFLSCFRPLSIRLAITRTNFHESAIDSEHFRADHATCGGSSLSSGVVAPVRSSQFGWDPSAVLRGQSGPQGFRVGCCSAFNPCFPWFGEAAAASAMSTLAQLSAPAGSLKGVVDFFIPFFRPIDERESKEIYTTCPIDPSEPHFDKILIANRGWKALVL